ncbi:MAG: vitamin K epoxide reductase family protein [Actinomycetales bacterium]
MKRPGWLAPTSLVLCLIGLGVSVYLSYEHATANASLYCPTGASASSCLTVTTSPWSTLFGIPVAYLGLGYYVFLTGLCLPAVWRSRSRLLDPLRLISLIGGLGMVLYLVWAELFRIHAICTWCTVVHVSTFALLGVVAFGQILSEPDADVEPVGADLSQETVE